MKKKKRTQLNVKRNEECLSKREYLSFSLRNINALVINAQILCTTNGAFWTRTTRFISIQKAWFYNARFVALENAYIDTDYTR